MNTEEPDHPKRWATWKKVLLGVAAFLCIVVVWAFVASARDGKVLRETEDWRQAYGNELDALQKIGDEYNALRTNTRLSEDERIAKLTDIASRYADAYQRYESQSQGYTEYLNWNKGKIERATILNVEEEKRRIQGNNVLMRQNTEIIKDALQAAVSARSQRQQAVQNLLGIFLGLL